MQLIQLKHFVSVVTYGSMNLAAEKLFVSQSAISQSIHKLEKEYEVQFFDRTAGGKLRLNKSGEKMLAYAKKILYLEEEMKMAFVQNIRATITLCSGGGRLFPALLGTYAHNHPNIKFNTRVGTRADNIKALIDGTADVIIDCGYIDEPENMQALEVTQYITDQNVVDAFCKRHNLKSILFYKAKIYLCVPPDSIYAEHTKLSVEELAEIPIIRSNYMLDFENWLTAIERYYKIHLNTIMTVDSDTYNHMVFQNGYNTLIMSTFVLNDERFRSQCRLIPIDDPITERDFYLYAQKGNAQINDFLISALNDFDWTYLLREG